MVTFERSKLLANWQNLVVFKGCNGNRGMSIRSVWLQTGQTYPALLTGFAFGLIQGLYPLPLRNVSLLSMGHRYGMSLTCPVTWTSYLLAQTPLASFQSWLISCNNLGKRKRYLMQEAISIKVVTYSQQQISGEWAGEFANSLDFIIKLYANVDIIAFYLLAVGQNNEVI